MDKSIADRLGQSRFPRDFRESSIEPDLERVDQRFRLRLPRGAPLRGQFASDAFFDLVKGGDPQQGLCRDRGFRRDMDIVKFSTRVSEAEGSIAGPPARPGAMSPL